MKLYTFPPAPNPRRLQTYLGEKQIRIPVELVSLPNGDHKRPEIVAKNPMAALPFLELEDGTVLTESLAIMEYLEELHPDPPMLGRTPVERALVRAEPSGSARWACWGALRGSCTTPIRRCRASRKPLARRLPGPTERELEPGSRRRVAAPGQMAPPPG